MIWKDLGYYSSVRKTLLRVSIFKIQQLQRMASEFSAPPTIQVRVCDCGSSLNEADWGKVVNCHIETIQNNLYHFKSKVQTKLSCWDVAHLDLSSWCPMNPVPSRPSVTDNCQNGNGCHIWTENWVDTCHTRHGSRTYTDTPSTQIKA